MVNRLSLDSTFSALSDPTRRGILARLSRGPATVGELGAPFDITKPAVTKHVKVLERAGLLVRTRSGRQHHCRLDPAPLAQAQDWIEQQRRFWELRLDALARYLEEPPEREET